MNESKIMSFTDDNGAKVDYQILEQLLINSEEYVLMSPVKDTSHVEVYKLIFDKQWNESLEAVESEHVINMVRQVSHVKF